MSVMAVPATPDQIEVPLSLQSAEALITKRRGKGGEDAAFDKLAAAAAEISSTAARVQDVVTKVLRNELATPLARAADAKRAANKLFQGVAGKLDSVRADTAKTIAALEAQTLPCPPKDGPAAIYHAEVRTALARMAPADRTKVIRAAIKNADDVFTSAVILGNAALTGLSQSERDGLALEWQRTRHGPVLERIERLRAGLTEYDRLCALLQSFSLGIMQSKNAAVAAAEHSAELARAAMAGVA